MKAVYQFIVPWRRQAGKIRGEPVAFGNNNMIGIGFTDRIR